MAVKIIRFINGDELIGECKYGSDSVNVTNPLQIIMVPGQNLNQGGIAMAPFMPYAGTKTFEFNPDTVMTMVDPVEQMHNKYVEAFSGIVIAKTL
jgi:hypothetical protein